MRSRRVPARWLALALGAALGLAGCAGEDPGRASSSAAPSPTTPSPSPTASATETPVAAPTRRAGPVVPTGTEVVATGLTTPWGLAFLPDGTALVSERDTGLVKLITAGGSVQPVGEVPGVDPGGEGGLLGLAVLPASAPTAGGTTWVYAYLTAGDGNRVVRMPYTRSLGDAQVLLNGMPKAGNHNGGGLAFGPDGMLYVATGDAGDADRSQDRASPAGKILRVAPDGAVPGDNPFPGSPVWSMGHRNVQGLAFDDAGRLWASEFGQKTYDELNLIERGGNYGWPTVEGPGDGGGRFVAPVATWRPTAEASPSGLAWVADTAFLGALRGERLLRVPLPGGVAGQPDAFLVGELGRLRAVVAAPDGSLWVGTSNTDGRGDPRAGDDRILRVPLAPG